MKMNRRLSAINEGVLFFHCGTLDIRMRKVPKENVLFKEIKRPSKTYSLYI